MQLRNARDTALFILCRDDLQLVVADQHLRWRLSTWPWPPAFPRTEAASTDQHARRGPGADAKTRGGVISGLLERDQTMTRKRRAAAPLQLGDQRLLQARAMNSAHYIGAAIGPIAEVERASLRRNNAAAEDCRLARPRSPLLSALQALKGRAVHHIPVSVRLPSVSSTGCGLAGIGGNAQLAWRHCTGQPAQLRSN